MVQSNINNQESKNVQAVIFNGGRGYRLSEMTKGEIPKGFLIFNNLPLISYQIKALISSNIKDIIIILSTEVDRITFKQFVLNKKIPKANFKILVIKYIRENNYSSPYLYFKNPIFTSEIGNQSLITINSDNIFKAEELVELVRTANSINKSFITTFNKPVCKNPFLIKENKIITLINEMFVEDSDITGVTYYTKDDIGIIKDSLNIKEPHVHKAVKILIDKQRDVSVKKLSFFINMNSINEYNQVVEYITLNPNW